MDRQKFPLEMKTRNWVLAPRIDNLPSGRWAEFHRIPDVDPDHDPETGPRPWICLLKEESKLGELALRIPREVVSCFPTLPKAEAAVRKFLDSSKEADLKELFSPIIVGDPAEELKNNKAFLGVAGKQIDHLNEKITQARLKPKPNYEYIIKLQSRISFWNDEIRSVQRMIERGTIYSSSPNL